MSPIRVHKLLWMTLLPKLAERVGFEPTVPLLVHVLSKHAESATLAPLHSHNLLSRPSSPQGHTIFFNHKDGQDHKACLIPSKFKRAIKDRIISRALDSDKQRGVALIVTDNFFLSPETTVV